MTTQTERLRPAPQKRLDVRRVAAMTGDAIARLKRRMLNCARKEFGDLRMARQAQRLRRRHQQIRLVGRVRPVTAKALFLGKRRHYVALGFSQLCQVCMTGIGA